MEKEKSVRKKSSETPPPTPPPPPPPPPSSQHKKPPRIRDEADPFIRIATYKERESLFLKSLNESIKLYEAENGERTPEAPFDLNRMILENLQRQHTAAMDANEELVTNPLQESEAKGVTPNAILNECSNYLSPLMNRTGVSVAAAISTKGALDQLDKLHCLVKQLITLQEQNIRMQRCIKNVETLHALKLMQNQVKTDTIYESDPEFDTEFEQNFALLETILATGRSASSKRTNTKRHRSKSVLAEDIHHMEQNKENNSSYVLRRQSAMSTDFKPKVSKWTKVKAAFKWEKANALQDTKPDMMLAPINNEVARYLRVPSITHGASSVDSAMSSSSGHFLSSAGSAPATPGDSSESEEDLCDLDEKSSPKRDSIKSENRPLEEEARKSLPLDAESTRAVDKAKTKSAWSKVKGIVKTHRGSIKNRSRSAKTSNSVGCSRDASPCESIDTFSNENRERTDSFSSSQTSPSHRNHTPTFTLTLPSSEGGSCPNSPTIFSAEDADPKSEAKLELRPTKSAGYRGPRKSKHIPGIESLPEGIPLESVSSGSGSGKKHTPSPLNLRQDYSSDGDNNEQLSSPGSQENSKSSKSRKTSAPTTTSMPNSPSKNFEFFGEFDSDDVSSGDFSEPTTPQRKLSAKSRSLAIQREEIKKKYLELQKKLHKEFEAKQMEWERIRPATVALSNSPIHMLLKDTEPSATLKTSPTQPITEENLPPDFKKKLNEWRTKHQPVATGAIPKETDPKKKPTDWQKWKTGQVKLEGQGLKLLPDAKDLPEDFQKKLSEWKQMKAGNKVPAFPPADLTLKRNKQQKCTNFSSNIKKSKIGEDTDKERHKEGLSKLKALVADTPKKEVVVQTTKGVMKFEGISRKFTRKLYEWEKSKGIGPEASTFALLHPGYRPVVVENANAELTGKRERSPGLVRSFSADSIAPNSVLPTVSHHPSSLSLNDADSFLDAASNADPRRISSNPELDLLNDLDGQDENDEPEAVLVEVQDFEVETATPLITVVPIVAHEMQPIYKYEPAQNIKCADTRNPVILRKSHSSLDRPYYALKNAININETLKYDEVFDRNVERLKNVLKSLIDSLPFLRSSVQKNNPEIVLSMDLVKGLSLETIKMLKQLERYAGNQQCLDSNIASINEKVASIKQILNSLAITKDMFKTNDPSTSRSKDDTIPEISISPPYGAHASEILHMVDHLSCDEIPKIAAESAKFSYPNVVKVNQVEVISHIDCVTLGGHRKLTRSTRERHHDSNSLYSESDHLPNTSQSQDSSYGTEERNDLADTDGTYKNQDVETKRLTRNSSNGSRRKTRIRRMGSRQNSKTDSDSDDEPQTFGLDAPRKTKRKTSRATKKQLENEKRCDTPPTEEVVYVFKIRPVEGSPKSDGNCLISPTETCVELLEASQDTSTGPSSVLIPTKRKLFTPVKDSHAVIVHEIESPTKEVNDLKTVDNLPPLPQSPCFQRKLEQMKLNAKEMSPNIRMMITKYNQKLSTEKSSPQSSGSCSPVAWRSPVLDRRVKKQTEMYQEKYGQLQKSSSAGSIRKTPDLPKETSTIPTQAQISPNRVLKSTSDGAIQMDWKIVDITKNIDMLDRDQQTHTLTRSKRKEFVTTNPKESASSNDEGESTDTKKPKSIAQSTGTIRKIRLQEAKANWKGSPHFSRSVSSNYDDEVEALKNTGPIITRKYETKPPSPRMYKKNSKRSYAAPNSPSICSSSSNNDVEPPTTPLSQRSRRIRQAREDFLNAPSRSHELPPSNRVSQFSTNSYSSTDESLIMKSMSANYIENAGSTPPNYGSLPRNISGAVALPHELPRSSRFGLSSLASKLKKVKLRKSSKDLSKLTAVSALCRQSLVVDIGNTVNREPSDGAPSNELRSNSVEPLKKSSSHQSSTGLLARFRKHDVAKLKKSRSLGLLEDQPNKDGE